MHRRHSKRILFLRQLLVYSVMVLAVVFFVGVIVLFILGYRLGNDNQLEQGALVQFQTSPTGAEVTVNGIALSGRTPTKATILEGSHTITMNRDGYETWQKSVNLVAGTLTWLDYPILVPVNRTAEEVQTYPQLVDAKASADRRRILMQPERDTPLFHLVNLDTVAANSSRITLPESSYTPASEGERHQFIIDRWDNDGRYAVLRHTVGEQREWIVLDTQQPGRSVNITELLDITIMQIRFSGSSGNIFFARLDDGSIRKLDLNAGTISRALVTNATDFSVFDSNVIVYNSHVAEESAKQYSVGVYKDGESAAVELFVSNKNTLKIATTRYVNENYIAVASGSFVTIYRGDYPRTQDDVSDLETYGSFDLSKTVENLSFSREGSYLIAQADGSYMTFDQESKNVISASVDSESETTQPLKWIAPGYLYSDYGGDLILREFDGTNMHTIMRSTPGFGVTFTANEKYLYSVLKNDDETFSLRRVQMVID